MMQFHPRLLATQPWLADETLHPFAESFDDEANRPVLSWVKIRDLPRRFQTKKWRVIARQHDWRCFFTGVHCYATQRVIETYPFRYKHYPWALTLEHLVSMRYVAEDDRIDTDGNLVVAGAKINERIGHDPLPVKDHAA